MKPNPPIQTYQTKFTKKTNIRINQTKPLESILSKQAYQIKSTKPNLLKGAYKPNQSNQTYKPNLPTKPTKPDIPNQTYQTKPAKSNLPNQT